MTFWASWLDGLGKLYKLIKKYEADVGSVARQFHSGAMYAYSQAINKVDIDRAKESVAKFPSGAPEDALVDHLPGRIVSALDEAYNEVHMLGVAAANIMSSGIKQSVSISMSETYESKLRDKIAKAQKLIGELKNIMSNAADQLSVGFVVSAQSIKELESAYGASSKSPPVIRYVINSIKLAPVELRYRLMEQLKEESLGGTMDTKEMLEKIAGERERFHPVQSMGISFDLYKTNETNRARPENAVVVDNTLPRAMFSIVYNMYPLIDYDIATSYEGQLSMLNTGLNKKLINRLRTIYSTKFIVESQRKSTGVSVPKDVFVKPDEVWETLDAGFTFAKMTNLSETHTRDINYSHVACGPHRRVINYYENLDAGIFSRKDDSGATPFITNIDTVKEQFRSNENEVQNLLSVPSGMVVSAVSESIKKFIEEMAQDEVPKSAEELRALVADKKTSEMMVEYVMRIFDKMFVTPLDGIHAGKCYKPEIYCFKMCMINRLIFNVKKQLQKKLLVATIPDQIFKRDRTTVITNIYTVVNGIMNQIYDQLNAKTGVVEKLYSSVEKPTALNTFFMLGRRSLE